MKNYELLDQALAANVAKKGDQRDGYAYTLGVFMSFLDMMLDNPTAKQRDYVLAQLKEMSK